MHLPNNMMCPSVVGQTLVHIVGQDMVHKAHNKCRAKALGQPHTAVWAKVLIGLCNAINRPNCGGLNQTAHLMVALLSLQDSLIADRSLGRVGQTQGVGPRVESHWIVLEASREPQS